jgi:hypothetical protein
MLPVVMVTMALTATACTPITSPEPGSSDVVPTKADIAAVAKGLPADPVLAAMKLVDELEAPDRRKAAAAAAEVIVRSGLALTEDSAVMLAPHGTMAADEFVPVDGVPVLLNSVLDGVHGDPEGFATFLASLGVTTAPLSSSGVRALVHGWGETSSATEQDVFVGAALRALAARRDALGVGGGPDGLDALQQVLLYSRITATFVSVPAGAKAAAAGGASVQLVSHRSRSSIASECEAELKKSETLVEKYLKNAGVKGAEFAQEVLEAVAHEKLEALGAEAAEEAGEIAADAAKITARKLRRAAMLKWTGKLGGAIGKADTIATVWQTALQTLLLIAGIRLKLEDDAPDHTTHFRHRGDGDPTKTNGTFTATVGFDRGNVSKQMLACYHALGIDLPDDSRVSGVDSHGNRNGWNVVWSIGQNLAPNNWFGSVPHGDVLRPAAPDWGDFRQPLSRDGTAKMVTRTRTERDSPQNKGSEHKVAVDVSAKVDYSKPIDLTQFTDVTDIMVWLSGDLARSINFPRVSDRVTVGYHGPDIYLAKGHAVIDPLFALASMTLDADTYTCDGLAGPWKGSVALGGQLSVVG